MADIGRNLNKMPSSRISTVIVAIVVLSVVTVHAKFGADNSVCNIAQFATQANTNAGPKKPTLPPQYTVRIEGNILEQNYTQDIQEFYDGPDNKGAVIQYANGVSTQMIFLYPTNELITLMFDNSGNPPRCHVDDLTKSTARNVFGLIQYANGSEHIFSANQALRFGSGTPEVYINRTVARDGITVDQWQSCMYWDAQDATLKLTWQFSANNSWTSAINKVVPVQLLVTGKVHVNSSYTYNVNRRYVFTDFRPVLFYGPIGAFETPQGTYCRNRVSLAPLRNVTSMFSYSAEIFEPETSYINWIKEYYDYNMNLVRYDYAPDPGSGSIYGNNRLIRVHDFNTGVAYTMDPMLGNCSITPISAMGFDAKSLDSGKVRISTSKELFFFDKVKYEYAGQRLARGITCDVWVAIRNDYPPGYDSPQSTWEWYFASAQWMENVGKHYEFLLPVMLQVTSQTPPMNLIYNIYDYNEGNPNIWATDISGCFNYTHRKAFQIAFPGVFQNDVQDDVGGFKFAVMQSIVALGDISPLRISDTQVDYSNGDVVVSFTILDKPPIPGDAGIRGSFVDMDLSDVVNMLNTRINNSQFVVLLNPVNFPNIPGGSLTAKPFTAMFYNVTSSNGTSSNVNPSNVKSSTAKASNVKASNVSPVSNAPTVPTIYVSQGYSSGAMGGLGVAMLIIGIAIGLGILFSVYKWRGFAPSTFTYNKEMEGLH